MCIVRYIGMHKMTFITPIKVFRQINWLQSQKSWLSLQLLFHLLHITPQGIITALYKKMGENNIQKYTCNRKIWTSWSVTCKLTFYVSTYDLLHMFQMFIVKYDLLHVSNLWHSINIRCFVDGIYFKMFKQQRILLYCFTVLQRLGQKYEVCDGGWAAEVVEVHLDDPLTWTQVLTSGL